MRLSSAWTTIVMVIVAVSAFGLVPAVAQGAHSVSATSSHSGPSSHPRPQASVGVFTTDQYGSTTSDFSVGLGASQVSFWAYDFGGDGNATVTIHDLNHTRDGLTDPVYTHRIHIQGGYNYSYQWNIFYQIPLSLNAPGTWNITINGTLGGFASQNFTVHTYYAYLNYAQGSILSGHSASETYGAILTINGAPYPGAIALTVLGIYFKSGNWTAISGFPRALPSGSPIGEFNYTVPGNTSGQVRFMLWANVSTNGTKWSETASDYQTISTFVTPLVSLTGCPEGCGGGPFPVGSTLFLTATTRSTSGGGPVPQPGLHVRISFQVGTKGVAVTGVQTNYTSNGTGGVALQFPANVGPFSTNQTNYVNVNVTDPLNPTAHYQTVQIGFDLTVTTSHPRIEVLLDSSTYFGGQTATATWSIGTSNGSAPTGWVADFWEVYTENPYNILGFASISSTATSGSFTFVAPSGYNGVIYVYVEAHNQTNSYDGYTDAWVGGASILLSPNEQYYLPGDTVTVSVGTQNLPTGALLTETVVDGSGTIISQGPVAGNNQIPVKIPMVAPPTYLYFNVVAQDATSGAVITRAYVEVSLGAGLVVTAGVQTKSSYADGSYQPGQTVTITYSISTRGDVAPAKWFDITVCPGSIYYCGVGSVYLETSSTSGTFDYKIPSGTPAGSQQFTVYVYSISCGGYSYCYNGATFSVPVNPSPSALQYELGAGSGVTVGWLILLIIILVVGLLLFLIGRRRSKGGSMGGSGGPAKAWSSSDSSSSSSSSSGGSSSPPAADPNSTGGGGAPPLPTPSK